MLLKYRPSIVHSPKNDYTLLRFIIFRYAGIALTCQLFWDYKPEVVSIVSEEYACVDGSNALGVHDLKRRTMHVYDFTVCLSSVITDQFVDTRKFVEWMEVQEMFGADLVLVYRHSLGLEMRPFIKYYEDFRKKSYVVDWSLPFDVGEIHELGRLPLLFDCLYRTMYTSRHAVFLDLNEFLVPRSDASFSWYDVIHSRDCLNQSQILVQQVSFDAGAASDDKASGDAPNLLTLTKTLRAKRIAGHQDGSRYMVRPEEIRVPGVFSVHRFLKKTTRSQTCYTSPKEALVHTYLTPAGHRPLKPTVVDRTFHKFQQLLVSKVELVLSAVSRYIRTIT